MRISTIVISTLLAIAGHKLAYTTITGTLAQPEPEPPDQDKTKPSPQASPKAVTPVAKPEQVAARTAPIQPLSLRPSEPLPLPPVLPPPGLVSLPPQLPVMQVAQRSQPSVDAVVDQLVDQEVNRVRSTVAPVEAPASAPVTAPRSMGFLADIRGHWAQDYIRALVDRGIVQGFADGSFRPDAAITPKEFDAIVQKAFTQAPLTYQQFQTANAKPTRATAAALVYELLAKDGKMPPIAANRPVANPPIAQAPNPAVLVAQAGDAVPLPLPPRPTPDTADPAPVTAQQPTPIAQTPAITPIGVRPATSLSAQEEDYILGAGDRLRLEVQGVPEYGGEYQVLVNGSLNLPLVGQISVGGLTLKQASDRVATRYRPLLKRSLVTLNLLAPRPLTVAISGEVNRPGSYTLAPTEGKFPTLTKALQQAAGVTRSANLRQVQLRRAQTGETLAINVWQLLQAGDLRQDITLRDGDSLYIPALQNVSLTEASQLAAANIAPDATQPIDVAVVGAVSRPGPHTLTVSGQNGKGGFPTVTRAIQQAGGITQLANIRQVEVRRQTRTGSAQTIKVNLWQLLQQGDLAQDLVLQQGDTVMVPIATAANPEEATQLGAASFSPDVIKVNVVGEVTRPGTIDVAPNTPLSQALLAAGGFTKRANSKSVELVRLNSNGTVTRQRVMVDLAARAGEKNPMLRPNDIILVDRSGGAIFSDSVEGVLNPLGRILPFVLLGL